MAMSVLRGAAALRLLRQRRGSTTVDMPTDGSVVHTAFRPASRYRPRVTLGVPPMA